MSANNARNVSVIIAKSDAMNAELLAAAFVRHPRFHVVARASNVAELIDLVNANQVDVVLTSASLQDGPMSGVGAVRQLRECSPEVKSVVLLDAAEANLIVDAFRSGAKGVFCPSHSDFKTLCKCVDRVNSGQIWANSNELGHVLESFAQLAPLRVVNTDGLNLLSKREEDVVKLLAEGLGNRDIARELNLSEHTVKNYLFHIFDKLGVSSRVELVLYAISCTKRVQFAAADGDHAASTCETGLAKSVSAAS